MYCSSCLVFCISLITYYLLFHFNGSFHLSKPRTPIQDILSCLHKSIIDRWALLTQEGIWMRVYLAVRLAPVWAVNLILFCVRRAAVWSVCHLCFKDTLVTVPLLSSPSAFGDFVSLYVLSSAHAASLQSARAQRCLLWHCAISPSGCSRASIYIHLVHLRDGLSGLISWNLC